MGLIPLTQGCVYLLYGSHVRFDITQMNFSFERSTRNFHLDLNKSNLKQSVSLPVHLYHYQIFSPEYSFCKMKDLSSSLYFNVQCYLKDL